MTKHLKKILLVVLVLLCLIVPSVNATEGETYDLTVKGTRDYTKAYEVLDIVNAERKKVGLSELIMEEALLEDAMVRAAELVTLFSHERPTGEDCFTIVTEGTYNMLAENIAAYQTSSKQVMNDWMNSEGHKKNILTEGFDTIGVGCFMADNGYTYWVQLFSQSTAGSLAQKQENKETQETYKVKYGLLPFTDVKNTDYFYEAVCYNLAKKQILGFNSTSFKPGVQMNRAMFVTVLWRIEGEPEPLQTNKKLSDIKAGEYYETAVKWAVSTGVVNGFEDGTFRPGNYIRRQDIVVILRNYLNYKKKDVSVKNNGTFESFADNSQVEDYAKESVKWAVENKVINGKTTDGKKYIDPLGSSVRADVACILYNYGDNFTK